jgi:hypothetical protein
VSAGQIQKRNGSLEVFRQTGPGHPEYGRWLALSTPGEDPRPKQQDQNPTMNRCLTIAFMGINLGVAGCRSGGTDATLDELSSELDRTEKDLKQVVNKPPKEGVELLDSIYERHGSILNRITELTKSPVTKAQKDKFLDLLTRTKAQQT